MNIEKLMELNEKGLMSDETLAHYLNKAAEVKEEKELTWQEKNEMLKEKSRQHSAELKERIAKETEIRLAKYAERRLAEQNQKEQENKEKEFEEKLDFLTSLKDDNGKLLYQDLKEQYNEIDNYNDLGHFEEKITDEYFKQKIKQEQRENLKASQDHYKSLTNEERHMDSVNKYGINSPQGQNAKETYDRKKAEEAAALANAEKPEVEVVVESAPSEENSATIEPEEVTQQAPAVTTPDPAVDNNQQGKTDEEKQKLGEEITENMKNAMKKEKPKRALSISGAGGAIKEKLAKTAALALAAIAVVIPPPILAAAGLYLGAKSEFDKGQGKSR